MDFYATTPFGPFPVTTGAAFNTFTTRQDVTGNGFLPVIPNGYLRPGSQLEVDARGEFSTTGTPTLAIGIYLGTQVPAITTVIAESGAITTGSGAAAWTWELHWEGLVTKADAAGSMQGHGYLKLATSLTAYAADVAIPQTAAARIVAIDTTIARAIGVCATWGTSSVSNSIKVTKLSACTRN